MGHLQVVFCKISCFRVAPSFRGISSEMTSSEELEFVVEEPVLSKNDDHIVTSEAPRSLRALLGELVEFVFLMLVEKTRAGVRLCLSRFFFRICSKVSSKRDALVTADFEAVIDIGVLRTESTEVSGL
jgi:hypothetical protein